MQLLIFDTIIIIFHVSLQAGRSHRGLIPTATNAEYLENMSASWPITGMSLIAIPGY